MDTIKAMLEIDAIRRNCITFIRESIIKNNATSFDLINIENFGLLDDDGEIEDDGFYDLPRTFSTDKYSNYNEFAIVSIKIDSETKDLIFVGNAIDSESDESEMDFLTKHISTEALIEIVELIQKIEKK